VWRVIGVIVLILLIAGGILSWFGLIPQPFASSYGCADLERLWEANGGSHASAETAAAVALAESGGDPNAYNFNTDSSIDRGLWQINTVHGYFSADFDPDTNAADAVAISHNGKNWSPWTTYKSGAYRKYCGEAGK